MSNIITSLMMAAPPAGEGGQQGNGFMSMLIMMVPFALIFYFLILRPQKKQQKEHQNMLDSLQKNDQIQLSSGILGKIVKVDSDKNTMSIEIDKNTHTVIEVVKSAVVGKVDEKGENK